MSERIKLADMTLGQIKELKFETAKIISQCIADVIKVLNERYDVGETDISITTNIETVKDETDEPIIKLTSYETKIKFSNV